MRINRHESFPQEHDHRHDEKQGQEQQRRQKQQQKRPFLLGYMTECFRERRVEPITPRANKSVLCGSHVIHTLSPIPKFFSAELESVFCPWTPLPPPPVLPTHWVHLPKKHWSLSV